MRIETRALCAVEATPESFVTLPEGILGYDAQREFALVAPADYAPFRWLLSFDDPTISFPVLAAQQVAPDYHPPNGESWSMFHERVAAAWELVARIAAATPGNLAVVTHGLVCGALVERHLVLAAGTSAPSLWGNTALTEIDATPPWSVRILACVAHLDGDESPPGAAA